MSVAPMVHRRVTATPGLALVATAADLATYAGDGPVYIRDADAVVARDTTLGLWLPMGVHPSYSTFTLVGSIPDFGAVDQLVALASFVADTSEHSLSVGGTVYGPAQGATEQAALAALHALVVAGEEAGYSAAVEGTAGDARLRVAPGSNILPSTLTTVVPDLPTGWAVAQAYSGHYRIVDGVLQLHSGDGVTVDAGTSYALLEFTGLDDDTPADTDSYAVVARHSWTDSDDIALNSSSLVFSLRLSTNDRAALYTASGPNAEWTGRTAFYSLSSPNTIIGAGTADQERSEVWDVIQWQQGWTNFGPYRSIARRLGSTSEASGHTLGPVALASQALSWASSVEAPVVRYYCARTSGSAPSSKRLDVRSCLIFQQGL
jgi:hypothetical protein